MTTFIHGGNIMENKTITKEKNIDERLELLRDKLKAEKQEIINYLKSEELFSEKYYRNGMMIKEINRLSNVILNLKEWKEKKVNLYALSNYIDKNKEYYEKLNRGINLSKNAKFERLSDLIKEASILQVTLKNGEDGEKETERMIMLFSDKVKYARGLSVAIKDESSGKMIRAENDFIIIGENGIFTLEVKKNSQDRVVTENGNFINKNSKNREGSNIIEQCMLHENVVRRVLEEEILKRFSRKEDIEVHSVIISANNAINVENRSRFKVLLKNEIQNYILNEFEPKRKLSKDEIELYFNILKDREVEGASFTHNIKIDEIIEQISTYLVIEKNNVDIRKLLIEKREKQKQDELEEVERKAFEEKMERERLKKEQEISRAKEEREKAKRKNLMRIGSVIAIVVIVIAFKLVGMFNEYISDIKYNKRVATSFKENIELAINEELDDFSTIINSFNNSVEPYEAKAFVKLLKEDEKLKNKLFKQLDKKVIKERVVNDFITLDKYNRIIFKESVVSINTNVSELSSNCILKVNDENIEFNNTVELIPGIYDIKALDVVLRSETESITEKITEDKTIDLTFDKPVDGNFIDVNVVSNIDRGQVIINGEESNYFLGEGSVVVPDLIKGDSEISIKYYMPWGQEFTEAVLVNGVEVSPKLRLDEESAKTIEIINKLEEKYKDRAGDDEELSLTLYMDDLEVKNLDDGKVSIKVWTEFECNYVSFGMIYGVFEGNSEVILSSDGEIEDIYTNSTSLPGYLNKDKSKVIKYSDKSQR